MGKGTTRQSMVVVQAFLESLDFERQDHVPSTEHGVILSGLSKGDRVSTSSRAVISSNAGRIQASGLMASAALMLVVSHTLYAGIFAVTWSQVIRKDAITKYESNVH